MSKTTNTFCLENSQWILDVNGCYSSRSEPWGNAVHSCRLSSPAICLFFWTFQLFEWKTLSEDLQSHLEVEFHEIKQILWMILLLSTEKLAKYDLLLLTACFSIQSWSGIFGTVFFFKVGFNVVIFIPNKNTYKKIRAVPLHKGNIQLKITKMKECTFSPPKTNFLYL